MPRKTTPPAASSSRVVVRHFAADDAASVAMVMRAAFATFIPKPHQPTVFAGFEPARLQAANPPDGADHIAGYVAVIDGAVVGYIHGTANPFGFGTLSVIGIDPQHLHQGIGSQMMRKMLSFWRRRGMRKVSTCVSAHNSRAFLFYARHGFRPVGYQRDHFMVGVDEVLLDKFLEPRAVAGSQRRTPPAP